MYPNQPSTRDFDHSERFTRPIGVALSKPSSTPASATARREPRPPAKTAAESVSELLDLVWLLAHILRAELDYRTRRAAQHIRARWQR
ncbi:hypothetical protein ACWDYH_31305 [Nocardia goodfellowii]